MVSKVSKVISFVWDAITNDSCHESELSARVRYSVAEKIKEEWEDSHPSEFWDDGTKKQEKSGRLLWNFQSSSPTMILLGSNTGKSSG